ncbi:MAG: hypothetical protein ACJ8LN_15355, partial [Sulfurifustis sp.]
ELAGGEKLAARASNTVSRNPAAFPAVLGLLNGINFNSNYNCKTLGFAVLTPTYVLNRRSPDGAKRNPG